MPPTTNTPGGGERAPGALFAAYLSAERAGDDASAERALVGLFALLPQPIPGRLLVQRVLAARDTWRTRTWLDRQADRSVIRGLLLAAASLLGVALALAAGVVAAWPGELVSVAAVLGSGVDAAVGGLHLVSAAIDLGLRVFAAVRPLLWVASSAQGLLFTAGILAISASGLLTLVRLRASREAR